MNINAIYALGLAATLASNAACSAVPSDNAQGSEGTGSGGSQAQGTGSGNASGTGTGGNVGFDAGSHDAAVTGCTAVDLLFVIDNSGSMGFYQEGLALSFPGFVDAMFASLPPGTDLHVGITTTDGLYAGQCSEGTSNCQSDHTEAEILSNFSPPTAGLNTINGGQGRLYEWQGQHFYATNTSGDKTGLSQWFSGAATAAGENGCSIEMASAAAGYVAHPANAATNAGFIRDEGAVLVVFVLSDEPDKSPEPVQPYVDTLVQAKSQCGGDKCILAAGIVRKTCYDGTVDPTLRNFLESFGEPAITGDIGFPFPGQPPPDYSAIVGNALTQVIKQACDEIDPPK
jgi:hypothetical protein